MGSPLTLRVDARTRQQVARLALQRGIAPSEAIREAIRAWAARHEPQARAYDAVAELIGCVDGGDSGRSSDTGRRLARLRKARRRARA